MTCTQAPGIRSRSRDNMQCGAYCSKNKDTYAQCCVYLPNSTPDHSACMSNDFSCCCCCCFSHSAHWLPTRKKLLYTVANPARGLLNREKNEKEKVWQRPPPPPPPARCSFGEKNKNKNKSRDAFTCLGATQVGVTQVVSVRLASVQGFLRLVS